MKLIELNKSNEQYTLVRVGYIVHYLRISVSITCWLETLFDSA